MIYLVCYDITEDKLRTKVSKLLIAQGYERIQYSIFAGPDNPMMNHDLWRKLEQLDTESDENKYKIFVIPIPTENFIQMEILGTIGLDLGYITGKKSTLII